MKKTLAIILTLALVICMMPTSAFAAEVDVKNVTVSLKNSTVDYNGQTQTPELQFSNADSLNLAQGTHYQITWNPTGIKDAGTYTGTFSWITGDSGVQNGVNPTSPFIFKINSLDLSTANISTTSDILSSDISSNATLPTTAMDVSGESKLKAKIATKVGNIDLASEALKQEVTITYTYTPAVGNNPASVTVEVKPSTSANNNVVNSRKVSFPVKTDISNASIALANTSESFTYNGNAQTPYYGVTVKVGNNIIPTSGYTVAYSNNVNGGTYARATVKGVGLYSGTATSSDLFYINPKAITASGVTIDVSTGATDVPPTVTVKDGTKVLTKDTDYEVSFSGNVATITGKGNYSGTITRTYSFVDQKITGATIYAGMIYYYNGSTQEPLITVTGSDGRTLTKNVDYKVTYTQNNKEVTPKDAGTYNIIVTGIGKYAGTKNLAFTITPFQKQYITVTAASGYYANNPSVTVKSLDGRIVFVQDKDYKVISVTPNTYTNKVRVTLTTMGNIEAGTVSAEYALVAKSISSCTISFKDGRSSAAYTGSNIPINLVVKDGYYTTLTQGRDYKVTYKNATGKVVTAIKDAGTYTIEITGLNGYTGTTYTTFTVTGTDIGNYTVTLKESSVTADGRTKTPVITSVSYGYYSKLSSSDYTVSYQDSTGKEVKSYQMTAPGTYKVVVTGKNGYTGSCYATFTIVGLSQSITGVDGSYKVYPTSETFRLYPKATEGRFTYTSSDPSVASVDAFGNVTPYKAGRAKITISTTGNVRYNPVTTSTVIKVYPNKAAMTRKPWTAGKGKIKVRWNKQDNVTRYEVRYSKNKSFKKGTYKTKKVNAAVNAYTTQSTTLSGLNSGYTYYVKVRAVKEVYNDYGKKLTYYGKWSGWKSVRVK